MAYVRSCSAQLRMYVLIAFSGLNKRLEETEGTSIWEFSGEYISREPMRGGISMLN